MNEDVSDFRLPVHIIGCGGMGSHIAAALVRMGIGSRPENRLHLYDSDRFEEHNIANQYITQDEIGQYKVVALRQQLRKINPTAHILTFNWPVRARVPNLSGVVFVCVDSMESRRLIMSSALERVKAIRCVIETRMDISVGQSMCFDPYVKNHCNCWWLHWYSDTEAENMIGCGGVESVVSSVYGTAALALRQFESYVRYNDTKHMANRIYMDFKDCYSETEVWPTKTPI